MKSTFLYPILFALLLIIGFAGFQWFQFRETSGYPEVFPVESFMQEPLQYAGNRYHLNASVENILASEDDLGRIVLVSSDEGFASLPLFLPSNLVGNLAFQQKYRFKLSVESGGLLYVHGMDKI